MSLSKAIGIVSGINEVGNFFELFRSAVSYLRSQWNNREQEEQIQEHKVHEQQIQEHEVLQLQSDLRILSETLPSMYNLLDRAEWRSHEKCVAQLLPKLNDAVYDAEDLLDEFRWYEIKASVEGNNSIQLSSVLEFFHSVIQGSFNKVTDIQKRLSNLSSQLEKMGLREATTRFDKSVRPVTTSFPTEAKILGRENEIKQIIRLLGVPNNTSRSSSKRKRTCNASNNEPRAACVPVLPIVGLGGVGKTTLAQEIAKRVSSHFDEIIWICVSDEFDAMQLTKSLIKSLSGNETTCDNFDDIQRDLAREAGKKGFLLVLDDIWPDAVKEDGRNWRKFCAPLKNVHQESRLLVTTRFVEVAGIVGTMEHFVLEGLKSEVFWDLFKLCVFGSENYHIDTQLEQIGRNIVPKLKGSPLAAMTIGRLLRKSLTTKHWNDILNSELWQLRQEETDILPALWLSYMYLPFHLKRCFSFCAVYPKDYYFQKDSLAEIWVTEGFVEPQGNIPVQHTGRLYFEDLVNLSFFQKLHANYVIHDLMHDMAQLVSKDECFIVSKASDIEKVPQNVRHLSILTSRDFNFFNLTSLCKHQKLRTLFCKKSLYNSNLAQVTNHWITELKCLRAISLASIRALPDDISKLKHLRYLKISRAFDMERFPSSFCHLYNLQVLYARECLFQSLPIGFSNLINLHKFEAEVKTHTLDADALDWGKTFWLLSKIPIQDLIINNVGSLCKDDAAKIGNIMKKDCLSLRWASWRSQEYNCIGVLQALNPSKNLKSLRLKGYLGAYFPWGSHPCNLPTSASPSFRGSDGPENINQNEASALIVGSSNGRIGSIFSSLTELHIEGCEQLLSLEQFLQPDCVPAIKKVAVENCPRLSLKPSKIGDLCCLEELMVCDCPTITSRGVFSPYLKKLTLKEYRSNLKSILKLEMWSLPGLLELTVIGLNSLTFNRNASLCHHNGSNSSTGPEENINQNEEHVAVVGSNNIGRTGSIFPSLTELRIEGCEQLSNVEQFLQPECVPAIKKILLENCPRLSLKSAKVGDLCCLEELIVCDCPTIIARGVISPYLKKLTLKESRNPGGSLMSVLNLEMWSLPALLELMIVGFSSLTFIGKVNLSNHKGRNMRTRTLSLLNLTIESCGNMKNIDALVSHGCLPAIRGLCVRNCAELQCLPGERFRSFSSLRDLNIVDCPCLNWRSGMVLPSSLQSLSLRCCGDISSCFPGCLENLSSLQSMEIVECERVVCIPSDLWRNNLPSLKTLMIMRCPDLMSIGGPNAISHISSVSIKSCTKLEEIEQPMSVCRLQLY